MNPRTTGILLLVAAALGAFVYFYEIRGAEERREAEQAEKRLFGELEPEDIGSITIPTRDGESARVERTDAGWRVREPVDFPGDAVAIDAIASTLATLESQSVIEDPQEPQIYGLGEEAKTVRFQAGDEKYALRLGATAPVGGDTYVTTEHDPRIFTVETFEVNSLARSLNDLRERRPLRFDPEAVDRVEVGWADGGVVIEKRDEGWYLVEPLEARADPVTLDTFLSELSFLRASGFLDEPPPDAEVGLDEPVLEVALTLEPEEPKGEPRRLELVVGGKPLEDGTRAARAEEAELYKISKTRLDAFPTEVVAYRYKQLADFEASEAERVELVFQDVAAAEEGRSAEVTVEGTRGEAGWVSEPETMAPGKLARIVSELADLRAEDIVAESMGPEELAELGLAPPRAIFRVYGKAPEEGGEAELLGEVHLGRLDGEEGIFARTPDRETVYRLAYAKAEHLPVSLEALRNRFLSKEPEAGEAPAPAQEQGPAGEAEPE